MMRKLNFVCKVGGVTLLHTAQRKFKKNEVHEHVVPADGALNLKIHSGVIRAQPSRFVSLFSISKKQQQQQQQQKQTATVSALRRLKN